MLALLFGATALEASFLTKVLIIDDDINLTQMLKMTLESSGFDVVRAVSPTEGIWAARHQHPDAIILDFVMPMMNGVEVCQAIRQFSQVPILVLSVLDQPSIIAKVLDAGADDYLVKPVAVNILQAYLKKLARRQPMPPGTETHNLSAHPS
jgi:DNA-binding response OmpR family regulator